MVYKIYLAGPDVFREDPVDHFEYLELLTKNVRSDLTTIYPFDTEAKDSNSIFLGNCQLIRSCDFVVANLEPFRGACIDDGTAWEIGFAHALGKTIYGYTDLCSLGLPKITEFVYGLDKVHSSIYPNIENFKGNCTNLMIQESIISSGGKILPTYQDVLEEIHLNIIY